MIGLIARKEGMSRVFTDEGKSVPVTVLKIHSNVVSQIKTSEKDGYDAIQISAVEQSEKNQSKAEIGHLKKNNISFKKLSQEFSLNLSEEENLDIGSEIKADIFEEGQFVDVIGTTKGKGFAGTVKRWNFATHELRSSTFLLYPQSLFPLSFLLHQQIGPPQIYRLLFQSLYQDFLLHLDLRKILEKVF